MHDFPPVVPEFTADVGVKRGERRCGAPWRDPYFIGVAGADRHECDGVRSAVKQAGAVGQFIRNHRFEKSGPMLLVVGPLLLELTRGDRRHKWIRIDLAVRVMERDAHFDAPVLEGVDVRNVG